MAQAAVLTVNSFPSGVDNTQHQQTIYGLLTFTGSGGYTTGGIPLNNFAMVSPEGGKFQPLVGPTQTKPFLVNFTAMDSSLVSYNYDSVNDKLFAITAGAQVGSGVTLSGVISFEAHFARGV
jgi:hypothetical protein